MAFLSCGNGTSGGTADIECFVVYYNSTRSRIEVNSLTDATVTYISASVGETATIRGITFTVTNTSKYYYHINREVYHCRMQGFTITHYNANADVYYGGDTVIECLPQ